MKKCALEDSKKISLNELISNLFVSHTINICLYILIALIFYYLISMDEIQKLTSLNIFDIRYIFIFIFSLFHYLISNILRKIVQNIFTILFYIIFGFCLVFFHGIQWICFNVFGYQAHKKSVDLLNLFILLCLKVLGTSFELKVPKNIPRNIVK